MSNVPILACQPASPEERERLAQLSGQPLVNYTGSLPGTCCFCGRAVLIGPRQEAIRRSIAVLVACFFCAKGQQPDPSQVKHLGNPEGKIRGKKT